MSMQVEGWQVGVMKVKLRCVGGISKVGDVRLRCRKQGEA